MSGTLCRVLFSRPLDHLSLCRDSPHPPPPQDAQTLSVTQAFGLRERLDQTPEMRLVSSCSRPPCRAPCQETRALPLASTTKGPAHRAFSSAGTGRGPGGLQGVCSHPELVRMCSVIVTAEGGGAARPGHFPGPMPGVRAGLPDPLLPCVPLKPTEAPPSEVSHPPYPKQLQVGRGQGRAGLGVLGGPEGLSARRLSINL